MHIRAKERKFVLSLLLVLHKPTMSSYYEKFCIVFINFEFVFSLTHFTCILTGLDDNEDGKAAYYETY